ncbi:MAG: hypothetical protein RIR69_370 [Actinomycetota bacterium]|jgi:hypothetical protein
MAKFLRYAIVSAIVFTLLPTQLSQAQVVESSLWTTQKTRNAIGGRLLVVRTIGASAEFNVSRKNFALWYLASPRAGKVAVLVNGTRVRTIDQYSPRIVRKSVSIRSATRNNVVQVVALSTRNPKSKGNRVNIDAISPTSRSCAKGCVRNPKPLQLSQASFRGAVGEASWYPSSVPDPSSPDWVVAVGSYVRVRDVLPIDTAIPVIRAAACDQAKRVPRGIVILSFGRQVNGGSTGFERTRMLTYDNIAVTASAWAAGLAECGTGPWEVSIGTSNSGGRTRYNGFSGGQLWAQVVERARAISDPRVAVTGSVDIEPGWGPVKQARAWVDGYVASTQIRLWNFGSADGCPQSVGSRLTCNNKWTIDDVMYVSTHAGPNVVAMPQIHTQSGSQSRQWAVMAARAASLGKPLRIGAITVQTAACSQVRGGCRTTGISAWDGWAQLRRIMDETPGAVGTPIGAPMDIRWGWADGFVIPPPTTTTTTTVAPLVPEPQIPAEPAPQTPSDSPA